MIWRKIIEVKGMGQKFYLTNKAEMKNRFMLTQHMKSVIYALSLPLLELKEWIEKEVEKNPLLEKEDFQDSSSSIPEKSSEEDYCDSFFENSYSPSYFGERKRYLEKREKETNILDLLEQKPSLLDHLFFQASTTFTSFEDLIIAEQIIGNLNSKGFFDVPIEEIAEQLQIENSKIENALKIIQTFDPPGIAARNLQESFLIQLEIQKKEKSIAYEIVKNYFNEFIQSKFSILSKKLKITLCFLQEIIKKDLKNLFIIPSQNFSSEVQLPLIADLTISYDKNKWTISINDQFIPKISIQKKYQNIFHGLSKSERDCIEKYLSQGKWLVKAINSRKATLFKVTASIVKKQKDFLLGKGPLLPMNYQELSLDLNLHISTISRTISNKYAATPLGLIPLRSFFSSSTKTTSDKKISVDTALKILKKLINEEDKKNPFSDEALAKKIDKEGISLARRTIAKYRRILKIGPAKQRKIAFS